ncbi:MAG: hypothetical protein JW953_02960 [Anaerolineae bacterium]|nr:hypothetical protein [Anaerolineae bacterium]
MKYQNLSQLFHIAFIFVLLLTVATVTPVTAQEPETDESEVEIQIVDFIRFLWNPEETSISRGDGAVVTSLNIEGAQQISGFTLAIAYDASIVSPSDVRPGALLPGTKGVDYFFTVTNGGIGLNCGGDSSFLINFVVLEPRLTIEGSGSLVDILWRSDPDAAVDDEARICLDGSDSLIVDNNGVKSRTAVVDTVGKITVIPQSIFRFQILLEGGKNSGEVADVVPEPIFTQITINNTYSCDGQGVDKDGFCAFNNATQEPPYFIQVNRTGYLEAVVSLDEPTDATSILLLAGDLNNDNVVNILDIRQMAGLLGQTVGPYTMAEAADYTSDDKLDIMDLVLVAKNYGMAGPTEVIVPGDEFPFVR